MRLPITNRALEAGLLLHNQQMLSLGAVLAQATALKNRLPTRTFYINYAQDRRDFMVAFLAVLLKGGTTILPPNQKLEVLDQLAVEFPDSLVLSSQPLDVLANEVIRWQDGLADFAGSLPEVPEDQLAVIAFTSGSTGQPQANCKPWRTLVGTACKLAARFAAEGLLHDDTLLLGTVPNQHMYGLETMVMLPLFSPLACCTTNGFFPEDISTLCRLSPRPTVIITTPVHLRALSQSSLPTAQVTGIISATAPLPLPQAAALETIFRAPVWEIYGCTEAGSLATRRQTTDLNWRLLEGCELHARDGGFWVIGDHLDSAKHLQDQLDQVAPDSFTLGERHSDLIKVGGKRGSLSQITQLLLNLAGVVDAAVFMQAGTATARPVALVVSTVAAKHLQRQLAAHLDDAFVPRLIRYVPVLPRNANGKLTQRELQDAWQHADKTPGDRVPDE